MLGQHRIEEKRRFIIDVVFYAVIIGIIFAVCKYILPILTPFIIAFLIAALLQMPVRKMKIRDAKKRRWAVIGLCAAFYAGCFFLLLMLGTKMFSQVGNMIVKIPDLYRDDFLPLLEEASSQLENAVASIDSAAAYRVENMAQELTRNIGQFVSDFSVKALQWASGGATVIPAMIVRIIVTVVATFFATADFDKILNFFVGMLPEQRQSSLQNGAKYVKNIILIYLKSYTILFSLTFVELSIGLLILRIPYAVAIALAIAVFDILPVLGTGGILLPWAVILLIIGNTPLAIGILVLYIIITVVRNTLEPRIVGSQIGLHPLATLIAMFLGLKLLGLLGLILFPMCLAILMNMQKNGIVHLFRSDTE